MIATGVDALKSLELSNAMYVSGFKHKPVSIPVDAKEIDDLLTQLQRAAGGRKQTDLRSRSRRELGVLRRQLGLTGRRRRPSR